MTFDHKTPRNGSVSESLIGSVPRRTFLAGLAVSAVLPALPVQALEKATGAVGRPLISSVSSVSLNGVYPSHVQGVCSNNRDILYWSMTTVLIMTDATGAILKKVYVPSHHGDLCYLDGKVYVAVNQGIFNDSQKRADSWIYVYDANDLSFLSKHQVNEVVYGAGGMAFGNGKFLIVGGLPDGYQENYIYEYDSNFKPVREIHLRSGWTQLGIQTAAYSAGHWRFGCYGSPEILLRADNEFRTVERFVFNGSYGLVPVDEKTFLVGGSICSSVVGCEARLHAVKLDEWIAEGLLKPM